MKILYVYIACLLSMLIIDLFWIGVVAKPFYFKHLGYLFAEKFKLIPIILFYLIYIAGLLLFVIHPALTSGTLLRGALMGFLFGITAYATYDLTNHALVKDWPAIITVVDMLWGGFLTGVISLIGITLGRFLS